MLEAATNNCNNFCTFDCLDHCSAPMWLIQRLCTIPQFQVSRPYGLVWQTVLEQGKINK